MPYNRGRQMNEVGPKSACLAKRLIETQLGARITRPLLLLHEFDIAWSPCLVEPRFKWAVETQDREPASPGHCLNPIILFTGWGLWAEVDVIRAVRVLLYPRALATF